MKRLQYAMMAALVLMLAACATGYHNTKLLDSKSPVEKAPKAPYHSLVVGVLVDHELRPLLEDTIVQKLNAMGIKATAAHTVYGDKGIKGKSRDYLAEKMKEQGFDSALAIHLENKETENMQAGGGASAAAPVNAGLTMQPEVFSPDFYVSQDMYMVREDFWDVAQQAIVWQAHTVSVNTGGMAGLEKGADAFATTIANSIKQANLY
ncbi:hypothetical protein A11A3_05716 [Alcanivorax hongdengensis A-11-3]|uniref:Lipoprotein n=1 Tax=Alcanivorax hongdengensis A-11-3 TaxID=1177179 RepID=L0WD78_9GAMM|nr:hypothetical protein [Alcanivorax hongdengensis]EKF74926.1 hypothetical protein A11A3_05716 [Alcanivorax hongdengensis A-11-3]